MASHAPPLHRIKRARTGTSVVPRACSSLYTYPLATDSLPVYEPLTIKWDPTCLSLSASTIDLYLNVEEATGLTAVHEWSGIEFSAGSLDTQLKPGWWNASTGAGSVSGQLIMTTHGSPIWDTVAPAGPLFAITYNGTYPASVTGSASDPVYTGPSVESVANTSSGSNISGGKLGAAVAIPVLAVIACIGAYVTWNKLRKRPEQKRWSAVIDQRMSMISQGTWQPPRPSMSSRPGSHYQHSRAGSLAGSVSHHRPSGSIHSQSNTSHLFSDSHRPASAYSQMRPPQPAEMRQIGQGERASKVSFSDATSMGRPSFSSSRRPGPSSLRNPTANSGEPRASSYYAAGAIRTSMHVPDLPRSNSTWEQLADRPNVFPSPPSPSHLGPPPSPTLNRTRKPSNLSSSTSARDSVADPSLARELADLPAIAIMHDGDLAYSPESNSSQSNSPFTNSSPPTSFLSPHSPPKSSPPSTSAGHMPMAQRDSMMSPDELLRSYAVKRETMAGSASSPTLSKKPSFPSFPSSSSLLGASKRMMRNLRGSPSSSPVIEFEQDDHTKDVSPFDDNAKAPSPAPSTPSVDDDDDDDRRMSHITNESRYSDPVSMHNAGPASWGKAM